MATSSALGLGDLALVWSNTTRDADLSMIDDDVASDRGLVTAVLLSLYTDRRANDDDVPPSGDPTDRRGWWADEFLPVEGDKYGSRRWLLDRSKRTNDTARLAAEYDREALAWMLEDRVVASIDVQTEATAKALLEVITLHRPGKDPLSLRFQHAWDHVQEGI